MRRVLTLAHIRQRTSSWATTHRILRHSRLHSRFPISHSQDLAIHIVQYRWGRDQSELLQEWCKDTGGSGCVWKDLGTSLGFIHADDAWGIEEDWKDSCCLGRFVLKEKEKWSTLIFCVEMVLDHNVTLSNDTIVKWARCSYLSHELIFAMQGLDFISKCCCCRRKGFPNRTCCFWLFLPCKV